jgi:hypothetical protein
MADLGGLALGAAPLAGGVLLGGMAGKSGSNAPDLRAVIISELELLQRIPEDEVAHRAALKRMIGEHVEALLVAEQKREQFQQKIKYFTEQWRDIVLFITTLLFAVIIWHADHHRPIWLPLLIGTIVMAVVIATYVVRGFLRSVRASHDGDHQQRDREP